MCAAKKCYLVCITYRGFWLLCFSKTSSSWSTQFEDKCTCYESYWSIL